MAETQLTKCPRCHGLGICSSGYIDGVVSNNYVCPLCGGTGKIEDEHDNDNRE